MKIKNYQEDLVLNIVEIVLQERPDIAKSDHFLHDVAAYTLNRLPPRYILSERGFTRLAAEHWIGNENGDGEGLTDLVQVLLLVNRAIDTIVDRRHPEEEPTTPEEAVTEESLAETLSQWHNLPYMVGRVVDDGSREPLADVEVSLFIGDELVAAAEQGWANPYKTSLATKGFFSFRPKPVRSKSAIRDFELRITFSHNKYAPLELRKSIHTEGEYVTEDFINSDRILSLDTIYLSGKNGKG